MPLPVDGAVRGYAFRIGARSITGKVDRTKCHDRLPEKPRQSIGNRAHQPRIEVVAPGHTIARTIAAAAARRDGRVDLELSGATIHDDRFRGSAELVRR